MQHNSTHQLITAVFLITFGLSLQVISHAKECQSFDSITELSRVGADFYTIRATTHEMSTLTGISISELEWAKATNPLFTVIVEDVVIPYNELGAMSTAEQVTESGKIVRPIEDILELVSETGHITYLRVHSDIDKLKSLLLDPTTETPDERTEWVWVLLPPAGAGVCWLAAQHCWNRCENFVRSCPCGGSCDCGTCGQSGGMSCFTCPVDPPRDSDFL